jgi:hypothetical protein
MNGLIVGSTRRCLIFHDVFLFIGLMVKKESVGGVLDSGVGSGNPRIFKVRWLHTAPEDKGARVRSRR